MAATSTLLTIVVMALAPSGDAWRRAPVWRSMQSASDRGLGLPDTVLTELWRTEIPPENFAAVLSVFGSLPEEGQYDLALRLADAVAVYRLRETVEKQKFPQAHQHRKQLEGIGKAARRLLKLLGVDKAESVSGSVHIGSNLHPTATAYVLTGLYRVGTQRRPGKLASANERLATLPMLLSDLVEATEQSARETSTQRGRGGDRRAGQITAEVELMQSLIASYAALRSSFPDSGPEPAFDLPLKSFVRSGLRLVDPCLAKPSRLTDEAIRGAFNRMHKPKTES
jgi:hypothetical protein